MAANAFQEFESFMNSSLATDLSLEIGNIMDGLNQQANHDRSNSSSTPRPLRLDDHYICQNKIREEELRLQRLEKSISDIQSKLNKLNYNPGNSVNDDSHIPRTKTLQTQGSPNKNVNSPIQESQTKIVSKESMTGPKEKGVNGSSTSNNKSSIIKTLKSVYTELERDSVSTDIADKLKSVCNDLDHLKSQILVFEEDESNQQTQNKISREQLRSSMNQSNGNSNENRLRYSRNAASNLREDWPDHQSQFSQSRIDSKIEIHDLKSSEPVTKFKSPSKQEYESKSHTKSHSKAIPRSNNNAGGIDTINSDLLNAVQKLIKNEFKGNDPDLNGQPSDIPESLKVYIKDEIQLQLQEYENNRIKPMMIELCSRLEERLMEQMTVNFQSSVNKSVHWETSPTGSTTRSYTSSPQLNTTHSTISSPNIKRQCQLSAPNLQAKPPNVDSKIPQPILNSPETLADNNAELLLKKLKIKLDQKSKLIKQIDTKTNSKINSEVKKPSEKPLSLTNPKTKSYSKPTLSSQVKKRAFC